MNTQLSPQPQLLPPHQEADNLLLMDRPHLQRDEDHIDNHIPLNGQSDGQHISPIFSFDEHSKIETMTPSESLLDFPLHNDSPPTFSSPPQQDQQLLDQICELREENAYLRSELQDMRVNLQQLAGRQQAIQPAYSASDVNRLIDENRSLQASAERAAGQRNSLRREIAAFQRDLLEVSSANQELYRKVVSLTNQLERERREARNAVKETEERAVHTVEQERLRSAGLMEELAAEREESEGLRMIVEECNREIDRLNSLKGRLEDDYENILAEKQELQEDMDALQGEQLQDQLNQIRNAVETKSQQNQDLKGQMETLMHDYERVVEECSNLRELYEKELLVSEDSQETIARLQEQLDRTKKQSHPYYYPPAPAHNNNTIRRMQKADPNASCSASTSNRLKVLCKQTTRKSIMQELRRLIKEISRVDLENRITSLLHELYMDAEYRERTNIQMQEMIAQLQGKITQLESKIAHLERPLRKTDHRMTNPETYLQQLEESVSRYERLLLAADSEKLRLTDEVAVLKKENYQVRLELSNSQVDNETEELIEELTLQLEQEKHSSRWLQEENEQFRNEIIAIEKELHEKNKRIKLLMLNLNKRHQAEQRT